jgi:hypothetical protein
MHTCCTLQTITYFFVTCQLVVESFVCWFGVHLKMSFLCYRRRLNLMLNLDDVFLLLRTVLCFFLLGLCPKLLIWPSSARGMGLHTCSTSLTLLSWLNVKGLTQRWYVRNDKAYKLPLILLNFQGGTKLTNNNSTCVLGYMGQLHNYYMLLMGWGVTGEAMGVAEGRWSCSAVENDRIFLSTIKEFLWQNLFVHDQRILALSLKDSSWFSFWVVM